MAAVLFEVKDIDNVIEKSEKLEKDFKSKKFDEGKAKEFIKKVKSKKKEIEKIVLEEVGKDNKLKKFTPQSLDKDGGYQKVLEEAVKRLQIKVITEKEKIWLKIGSKDCLKK